MPAWRALRASAVVLPALLAACLHDVHRLGPIAPASPPRPAEVRVLVFGDFGYRTLQQWLVARAMRRATHADPFDLAVQLGDNLYMCGPDPTRAGAEACRFAEDGATVAAGVAPPEDPVFRVNERLLEGLRGPGGAPLETFLALGNHDIGWGGRQCDVPGLTAEEATLRRACLSVAHRSATWNAPGRHYVIDRGPIRIVVVDTNVVVADYGGFTLEDEIAFLAEATASCGAGRLCFVAGHHPPAAVRGWTARGLPYAERMARLLAAADGRAEAFFAGHYHTLQHLTLDGLEVFVSGSTAMGAYGTFRSRTPARARVRFATTAWGFTVLEADARGYRVRFVDFQGVPLHCCEAERGGACRPVHCG